MRETDKQNPGHFINNIAYCKLCKRKYRVFETLNLDFGGKGRLLEESSFLAENEETMTM